jgi:hypothetical protein
MPLNIATYRRTQRSGLLSLGPRALQVAAPVTFHSIGYPTELHDDSQIAWFVDTMHESDNVPNDVYSDKFKVTSDEARLVTEVCDLAEELTAEQFGRPIRPWVAPLCSLISFRLIEEIAAIIGRRLTIYEIGPGSGYLGAMAIRSGHRYLSTDVAEGMYLWQSRLQEKAAPGEFTEMAAQDDPSKIADPDTRAVHIPWWIHGAYYEFGCPFEADIVICEHTLGEMSIFGLRYAIAAAREMLKGRGVRLFVTTHIGLPNVSSRDGIIHEFYRGGFVPVAVRGPMTFVIGNSELFPLGITQENISSEIRVHGNTWRFDHPIVWIGGAENYYAPSGDRTLTSVNAAFQIDWSKAPVDYRFMKYIGEPMPQGAPLDSPAVNPELG